MKRPVRRLTLGDSLVLGGAALIIVVTSTLLFFEIRRSSHDQGERSVGEITYRNRVAQRRDPGRIIWSDVNPGDIVYDGDSVRTGDAAEAVIDLADGASIELDPDSLIVVSLRERPGVRLVRGSMIVRPGRSGVNIDYNQARYTAEGQSVRMAGNETEAEAEAGDGSALRLPDGTVVLRSGESAVLKNGTEQRVAREMRPLLPADNARFFVAAGHRIDVDFRWTPSEGAATLEVQRGSLDAAPVATDISGGRATMSFGEGSYFWRIRRGGELSPLRRLRVREKDALVLLQPAADAVLVGPGENRTVSFRWREHELASSYFVEIARDRGFSDTVAHETVQRSGIALSLPAGTYYWRIVARGSVPGADSESAARSFTIARDTTAGPPAEPAGETGPDASTPSASGSAETEDPARGKGEAPALRKNAVPSRPVLVYPSPGMVVDMTGSNALLFRWSGDPSVERSLVLREGRTGRIVYQVRAKGGSHALTDLTVLDTGPFEWSVDDGGVPIRARFTIVLHETMEKPKLEIK